MKPFAIILCLALSGCATVTNPGRRFFAPTTWFSHAPADAADKAHVEETKAVVAVDHAEDAAIRAAHVEFAKADIASLSLPASRSTDLVRRFLPNGLGLLDQVQPLTATESADLRAIVAGLLSKSAEEVASAEKKQAAAESDASRLSRELEEARAAAVLASTRADNADAKLRVAFDRENALANQLRAQRAAFWIAVGLLVIVSGLALYAKIALGGVGAALHAAGAPISVVQSIDAELSKFGQWMIQAGRVAAAKTEAALAAKTPTPVKP